MKKQNAPSIQMICKEGASIVSFFGSLMAYRLMTALCFLCIVMSARDAKNTGNFDGMGLTLTGCMWMLCYIYAKKTNNQSK